MARKFTRMSGQAFAEFNAVVFLIAGVCLLILASCSVAARPQKPPTVATGTFNLYLQPLPQEAFRVTFQIDEAVARHADGREVVVPLTQDIFSTDASTRVQKRIARCVLPPGHYLGMSLHIGSASIAGEEGRVDLLPPENRLILDYAFNIRPDHSETLYLSLSADRLITDGALFTPKFTLWKPERTLVNLKGFVSSSQTQGVTVFSKREAQVLDTIQVGAGTSDLVLDQGRGWLYAAVENENAIVAIEVNSGAILGRVPLRFGDEPAELALTADGTVLLALNMGSSTVSFIETQSLFETARVRLEMDPTGLFLGSDGRRAYVTHASENALSVIDLPTQSLRRVVSLDDAPRDGVANVDGDSLYLVNDYIAEVTVLDTASLETRQKIYVGHGAVSIKADRLTGLLYVGKEDGTIAVVDPRSAMAIDSFTLPPEAVASITIDHEENALFAVLPQSGRLFKVDLVSKRILGSLNLEDGSRTVVVMGER